MAKRKSKSKLINKINCRDGRDCIYCKYSFPHSSLDFNNHTFSDKLECVAGHIIENGKKKT